MSEVLQDTNVKQDDPTPKSNNINPYLPPEERVKRFEVAIKKEYLKVLVVEPPVVPAPAEGDSTNGGEAPDLTKRKERPYAEKQPPKKKGRYTKRAKRERAEQLKKSLFQGIGFCNAFSVGKECAKTPCPFSHDLDNFLKQKPADIGEACYTFDKYGRCAFGFRCRFAKSHIDAENKLIFDETKEPCKPVLNIIDRDTQFLLRKNKYPFVKAKAAVTKYCQPKEIGFLKAVPDAVPEPEKQEVKEDKQEVKENPPSNIVIEEKKKVDFKNKLILAPLTTIGNLPYRRICKEFGADITIGEMALGTQLLNASPTEWALVKRHYTEDVFGVQLAGAHANTLGACAELLTQKFDIDFIDLNCGCPIDLVCQDGAGSQLLARKQRLESICKTMVDVMGDTPFTIKIRTGVLDKQPTAHTLIPNLQSWGVSAVTLHGRSKEQRYTKLADFNYMKQCSSLTNLPFICNGDIYSWEDAVNYLDNTNASSVMLARGAIIKPWLFTEIKEKRNIDISGTERFDILKNFANYGLEHWGSDDQGIENTRHFLLNWMSFLCRYVPVGIVEHFPIKINHRPPPFLGRDDREILLSSTNSDDWIKISEMFLGPVPSNFEFTPKHRANAYQ